MPRSAWIQYKSNDPSSYIEIQENLPGLYLKFDYSRPALTENVFRLPPEGEICPIEKERFILKCEYTEETVEYEEGWWVGSGEPGYGQTWYPASQGQYLEDDDKFFLGSPRLSPSITHTHVCKCYLGGKTSGRLILEEIGENQISTVLQNEIQPYGMHKVECPSCRNLCPYTAAKCSNCGGSMVFGLK